MLRDDLRAYLDGLLEAPRFRDYCPNGLQVEGKPETKRILCGTTASQALIDAAIERQADAILVHHGWFWKGEDGRVTGFRKQRMAALAQARHQPLCLSPAAGCASRCLGNNAQLAAKFGWQIDGNFGEQNIGFIGTPSRPIVGWSSWRIKVGAGAGPFPQLLGSDDARQIKRVAWCSGGAQGYFEQAIAAGADLFLSGEVSKSRPITWRWRPAFPTSLPATMRPSATVCRPWASTWPKLQGLECEYLELENPV